MKCSVKMRRGFVNNVYGNERKQTMGENVILDKTMDFAVRIVNLYKYLCTKHEYVMSKQLLRCGTSVGANAHEANSGQSKKDFLAKMYVAFKEIAETEYWLILLVRTHYLTPHQGNNILVDCKEIRRILASIIKTVKCRIASQK